MKIINIVFLLALIAACNTGNKTDDTNNDTIKNYDTGTSNPEETEANCYESINGKDTVMLSIFHKAKIVTGSLSYNYFEKDKNSGTIKGNMFGDTLIADYVFMSEGTSSIREVAFLKQNNNLVEGYGDMQDANGKMVFKNRNALNFSGKPLSKVDCTNP